MARIAFFTERLPPEPDPISDFSYDLIRSLADQQHQIRVFSTYREGAELPAAHPRIEIARPFRKWSWLELPRLIPLLLEFRPELIHLVQPRAEAFEGYTNAMNALPGFGAILGRPAIVTSFYDLRREDLKRHRPLILASDSITVSNEPQKELVADLLALSGKSSDKITLLPVPSAASGESSILEGVDLHASAEALAKFLSSEGDVLFVPGEIGDHRETAQLFAALAEVLSAFPRSRVVFGGGWGRIPSKARHVYLRAFDEKNVGARFFVTGPLSSDQERLCFSHARAVFTASLPRESLGLARIFREALKSSTPLIMSEEQARVDALKWVHGENALITTSMPDLWGKSVADALASEEIIRSIRSRLPEFTRSEAVDQPGNVMSRIYTLLLDARRNGPRPSPI